jgi:coenzyme F420-reducing hydrogenase alpha subunit
MEIDMTLENAVRKVKASDREITYTWRSKDQNIEMDGDQWGGYVNLRISHDSDRKQFSAFIQFAHYNTSRGYESVQYTIWDQVNYPHGTVATQPIARYSAKALGEFETRVIELLKHSATRIPSESVREAWARATEIAMGGDGTLRYSEYVAI